MKIRLLTVICAVFFIGMLSGCADTVLQKNTAMAKAEKSTPGATAKVFTFPVCGAPNSTVPGWTPHGDPRLNGEMTAIIEFGKLTLEPSQELLDSNNYVSIHAHLYDAQHRPDSENTDLGQSTICWAYYNTEPRGGICDYDDYDCQALTGVTDWPWTQYGYYVNWYKDYLRKVSMENGEGWWFMLHTSGGHFATDESGHLVEWDGSDEMEASFGGKNDLRPNCNAHIGRTLADRNLGTGDTCNDFLLNSMNEDYFMDGNGVDWIDSEGNLTADAIAHGYDLDTEYLFYNYRDNGQSDRWGGPDGGAGGFLSGDDEGRCDNWPPAGYGDPHAHQAI